MASSSKRDDFSSRTKAALAKRSGFQCAICRAVNVGPSKESAKSVTNIGVAAHITAATPHSPRYDESQTSLERSDITNGIWLCQNHAKIIDDDEATWTVSKLHDVKRRHEEYASKTFGIPRGIFGVSLLDVSKYSKSPTITPYEYAFLPVRSMIGAYKSVLTPLLHDRGLTEESELGILMCGSPPEHHSEPNYETPWTVFVNADWLRWLLDGQKAGYKTAPEIPAEHIYGQIPAWPDSFFEFLRVLPVSLHDRGAGLGVS
ncbi:MAG: hypothetical protein JXA79_11655 [Deltaproteobacteria bacterium]|nr:hypothetical protein [Deltaproteobacteria bacterium]